MKSDFVVCVLFCCIVPQCFADPTHSDHTHADHTQADHTQADHTQADHTHADHTHADHTHDTHHSTNRTDLDILNEAKAEIGNSFPNASVIRSRSSTEPYNRYAKFPIIAEIIGTESNKNLKLYEILLRDGVTPANALKMLRRNVTRGYCNRKFVCSKTEKYRSIDGTCNNINHPQWGSAPWIFRRLLPIDYEDNFGEPRGGRLNLRLPNERRISSTLHPDLIHPDPSITNMVPQIGQFVDHDITLAPEGDKRCCTTDEDYVDCFPIEIETDDPFYSNTEPPQTCMDFTRSTVFCFPTSSGVREQFNILTAYLDLSSVYGSDPDRAKQVRSFTNGLLRTNSSSGFTNFLPTVAQVENATRGRIKFMGKFLAGDERVNEMPGLTVMHTVWLREHNRVAKKLKQKRPSWTDEKLFQETRRIVVAEWQNVVYGEFLPVVLGNETMTRYGLTLGNTHSTYNSSSDATIFSSFASAAYRFGHTLINGIVQLFRGTNSVGQYNIRDNFFESDLLEQNGGEGIELILGGLILQNAQTYDRFITADLTNHLLQRRTEKFGSDLVARNLRRGREHGVRPYNDYRVKCGLEPLTDWESRPDEILEESWTKLNELYESPGDIDLFSGGIVEIPKTGAVSGPTFNCIKAIQFHQIKTGDRFFFTHRGQVSSFTLTQLLNIRTRRLSDIFCDNTNIQTTPLNVFRVRSQQNFTVTCGVATKHWHPLNIDLFLS